MVQYPSLILVGTVRRLRYGTLGTSLTASPRALGSRTHAASDIHRHDKADARTVSWDVCAQKPLDDKSVPRSQIALPIICDASQHGPNEYNLAEWFIIRRN